MERTAKEVNLLRTRSGEPIVKFESPQTSQIRSVQGEWSTLTWLDSKQNSVPLPSKEFSIFKTAEISATEHLMNLVIKDDGNVHSEEIVEKQVASA